MSDPLETTVGDSNGGNLPDAPTLTSGTGSAPGSANRRTVPLAPPHDSPFEGGGEKSGSHAIAPLLARSGIMPMASGTLWQRVSDKAPAAPPPAVLEAKGLVKKFGKREVVCGVDISVGAGEIVGLLGRNGAGKTTTFRMIMGLLHPDKGSVSFQGKNITRLPMYLRAQRGIGYLAQQPSIFQRMTVEDNLLAVLEIQTPNRREREARLEKLIKALGLSTVRKSIASVVSGGERRRLEIARAMSLEPKIVLFDEPFASIDPITVGEIRDILKDLRKAGLGVLLTDHNVTETLKITDRAYIMDEGKIWKHGSPREIVDDPEAKARYLGHDFRYDF